MDIEQVTVRRGRNRVMSAVAASGRVSRSELGGEQEVGQDAYEARADEKTRVGAVAEAQPSGPAHHSHGHRPAPEHTHPDDVSLTTALAALADPMRLHLIRELADAADWEYTCGSFDVPIGKAALSHHFAVLRAAGLLEQRDIGAKRANRLRREEFERRFPGLLTLALRDGEPS
jgi:DNA-binding transcriptional ArsR family regulator